MPEMVPPPPRPPPGLCRRWEMAAVPADSCSPASGDQGAYHWLEGPVGSWEANRSLTLPSCWKLWPPLQSGCLGNTFQLQPQGVQMLLEICQGPSQGLLELGSLKARRPHSECGPDLDAPSGDICITASHPWPPSERMLMPGLHPRPMKSNFREGAHASKFLFSKASLIILRCCWG